MIDPQKELLDLSSDRVFGPTLEGEGEFLGHPSIFLRMAGCNLTCKNFASPDSPHGCDSFIAWSVHNKMTFEQVWQQYFVDKNYRANLKNGAILKLSGGEPIRSQKQLAKFVRYLVAQLGFCPRIDFETNATIKPDDCWVDEFRATFTTSPKLSTNGDPESKTYNPEVLKWHKNHGSGFKFVITCAADIEEIWRKYVVDDLGINIPKDRIWFMPACGSRAEHIEKAPAVAEYATTMGVRFSPRLHLLIWDMALGR